MNYKDMKVLTAFFSHKGNNYSNGKIVNLKVGNTAVAADIVAALTGSDLFEIEAVKEYPADYTECTVVAKTELRENARPALKKTKSVDDYDVIMLGYPSWWGTMPMPVWTFLSGQNLDGKIILPFCTNEGSGLGDSEKDLRKLCPAADIKKGLSLRGTGIENSKEIIEKWLDGIK